MSQASRIEWTEYTWNPVTGCSKVSAGCVNCYAERMALRLKAMGQKRYSDGFAVRCHEDLLDAPKHWRKPRMVFVNSMGDLFHEEVPVSFIKRVFQTMAGCPQHVFQVLTKRADRLAALAPELDWPANVWMGVTVEDSNVVDRVADLAGTDAAVKFLSCEPLLAHLEGLPLEGIDWLIAGGESGPRSRPMAEEWVIALRDQCVVSDVPFFFKQWGGANKKRAGRVLQGRTWDEMPR